MTATSGTASTQTAPTGVRPASTTFSRIRTRLLALLLVAAALVGLDVATAGLASATAANYQDVCWHGIGTRTLISETLPAGNNAGIILDSYLYHYNGSAWVYTGVSERLRGSTAGYWVHASGTINNSSGYNLVRNSGYYVLRNHIFWASNPSVGGWSYELGYADDLRGATTYCYA